MSLGVDLDELLAAVDVLSVRNGHSREGFLLDHGLRVHETCNRWTYSATPVNSLTFASTGGDGVHFGLLQIASMSSSNGPVVMTVPAASRANHVVAGSIAEFLGLGCAHGWFSLEQLAYRPEYALNLYADAEPPTDSSIAQLFGYLSVKPTALGAARLEALARQFAGAIVLDQQASIPKPFDREAFLAWKRSKYGDDA
ncbi:MAG TPA: hypothetical protein VER96_35615 [Polyangiaceae bacterium]|nr:hypothetical protein [Polyangiaceae bacterium]